MSNKPLISGADTVSIPAIPGIGVGIPPGKTLSPEERDALLADARKPPFPDSAMTPPLFTTRGVTIQKRSTGAVTLGEIRQFVAAAEGMDDGLPLKIQSWTDDSGSNTDVEVMDQVDI